MSPTGGNPIVAHLRKLGRQVTVESYLNFAYPDPVAREAEVMREAELAVQEAAESPARPSSPKAE